MVWNAVSAVASAIAAFIALVVAVFTYQGLDAARVTLSVAARNDTVRSLDEAIARVKADPGQAPYFFLVLRNVGENQRARVLTQRDAEFIADYLRQHPYLCDNSHLNSEWKRLSTVVELSDEVRAFAHTFLGKERTCSAERKP